MRNLLFRKIYGFNFVIEKGLFMVLLFMGGKLRKMSTAKEKEGQIYKDAHQKYVVFNKYS